MSWVTSIAPISTATTNRSGHSVSGRANRSTCRFADQPLGERCAAQKEEPRRADDEPEAPELGSELANVEEQRADEANQHDEQRDENRGAAGSADSARRRGSRRRQHRQRPREGAADRLAREGDDAEGKHAGPKVALVIQREVTIARMAVRGQIEQDEPSDARREHETGVRECGRRPLSAGGESLWRPSAQSNSSAPAAASARHERSGHRQRATSTRGPARRRDPPQAARARDRATRRQRQR